MVCRLDRGSSGDDLGRTVVTLVVPAAGNGSRLGDVRPKALTELGGRPLIEWVLTAAIGAVDRVVVVIRPQELRAFEEWAATAMMPVAVDWAFQLAPDGSLSAVRIGVARAHEISGPRSSVVILWADQVGVGASTIRVVVDAIGTDEKALALPLSETSSPYVWVELDAAGCVERVLRTRDGDVSPAVGLADLGVFGLSGSLAQAFIESQVSRPGDGREEDFTYELPVLSRIADRTVTPRIADEVQLLAVNTPEDLARARKLLVRSDD
jgi:CTP:molybdopterin cytidylyltransferase MocA